MKNVFLYATISLHALFASAATPSAFQKVESYFENGKQADWSIFNFSQRLFGHKIIDSRPDLRLPSAAVIINAGDDLIGSNSYFSSAPESMTLGEMIVSVNENFIYPGYLKALDTDAITGEIYSKFVTESNGYWITKFRTAIVNQKKYLISKTECGDPAGCNSSGKKYKQHENVSYQYFSLEQ